MKKNYFTCILYFSNLTYPNYNYIGFKVTTDTYSKLFYLYLCFLRYSLLRFCISFFFYYYFISCTYVDLTTHGLNMVRLAVPNCIDINLKCLILLRFRLLIEINKFLEITQFTYPSPLTIKYLIYYVWIFCLFLRNTRTRVS